MRDPRVLYSVLGAAIAALLLGCGEESRSPAEPSFAAAAPTALTFVQISAGSDHSCGTTTDGRAWCWGSNELGQLGVPQAQSKECSPPKPCSTRPIAVGGAARFRHVIAGFGFSCGVTTEDRVLCWGANDVGQLGRGSSGAFSSTPASVAGNRRYLQVRAGSNAACAITAARAAFCWGGNDGGQLGTGSPASSSSIPVKVALDVTWTQLTLGVSYGCGIITAQSKIRCWGRNAFGQFGDGSFTPSFTPVPGGGGLGFAQIEAGFGHTCGVVPDGRAFCWGEGFGLGDGSSPQVKKPNPTQVAGNRKWANVTAGAEFSCGVTMSGRGLCWGSGSAGQLGNGTNLNKFRPVLVAGSLSFVAISAGSGHACGVATNGQGWCWGDDSHGQLGDGSLVTKMAPNPVLAPAP